MFVWICKNKFTRTCVVEHGKINNYEIFLNFINCAVSIYSFDIIFTCFLNWNFVWKKSLPDFILHTWNLQCYNEECSSNYFEWNMWESWEKDGWNQDDNCLWPMTHWPEEASQTSTHFRFDWLCCALQQQLNSNCFEVEHLGSHHLIPTDSLNRFASSTQKKKLHLLSSANSIRTWNLITLLLLIRMNSFSQHQHIIGLIRSLEKRLIWFFPHS